MRCPQCQAEPPLWAQFCNQCGFQLYSVTPLQPPAPTPTAPNPTAPTPTAPPEGVTPSPWGSFGTSPAGSPFPGPPPPPPAPPRDFKPHLALGAVLAFVSTLVIPPLFGAIAAALGWLAYTRGGGEQKRQGLWLVAASMACMALGIGIAIYAENANLLGGV